MTRISFPIIIALFYFFTKALWSGGEVLFSWQVGQWQFMVYQQGVYQGAAAALRIISGVSMVIWLSLTTSVAEFIAAARWYRVPVVILELLVFIYHYIFILWQEAARVFQAQQLRLGHEKWRHSFMNMIKLAALVFVRAIDRAEVAAQAMQLRGYEENLPLEIFERRNP